MIKIKEIEITGNSKTLKYYRELGYEIRHGEKIYVKIEHLIKTSAIKVECFCDICGSENLIKYFNYIGNISRNGLYRCNECSKTIRSNKIRDIFSSDELKSEIVSKRRVTNMTRYGFDSNFKNPEIKNSIGKIMIERYGYRHALQSPTLKSKMMSTNLMRYGTEITFGNECVKEKIKNTMIERYGVDNPFKSEDIKNKIKKTLIDRYGVDNPTKDQTIFQRAQRSSYKVHRCENSNILYQGSYELDFILFCENNDINFENGPVIDYILDGVHRKYHSDFFLKDYNLICEVKSSWTYNRDLDENLKKREFSISSGYNFVFIIDKNYDELYSIIK